MAYAGSNMSPIERGAYQYNPMVMNAMSNYANYRGAALPSANIAMPKFGNPNISLGSLPSANISLGKLPSAKSKIDPNAYTTDLTDLKEAGAGVTDFEMNTEDSIYQWKQEQAKKAALSALSARGLSGSKYGISTLGAASMNVAAEEAKSQYDRAVTGFGVEQGLYGAESNEQNALYQRTYAKESDEYNRGFQNKMAQYQVKADNYQRGFQNTMAQYQAKADNWNRSYQSAMSRYQVASDNYNRAFQNASYQDNMAMQQMANTFNMASQIDNTQYGRMLGLVQIGAGAAGAAGQNAMTTGQGIAQGYVGMGNAQAGGYAGAGNAWAGMYGAAGAAPGNALATYYQYQNYNNAGSGYGLARGGMQYNTPGGTYGGAQYGL